MDALRGHRFGVSDRPGVDRCACGYERQLTILDPPTEYPSLNVRWSYRIEDSEWLARYFKSKGMPGHTTDSRGDWPHPCPIDRTEAH